MEKNVSSNEILEKIKIFYQLVNPVDYISLKKMVFDILEFPQIENYMNKDLFHQITIFLKPDDFFEAFYINGELKPFFKAYIIEMLESKNFYLTTDQILLLLFCYPDSEKDIEMYFPIFLENTNNLFHLKDQIEIFDPLLELTLDYMNQNVEKTIQDLIKLSFEYFKITDAIDPIANQKLEIRFKEIITDENVKMSDVIHFENGTTTCVYQVGSKVLKFSVNKRNFPSIDHPRILKPISKKDISFKNENQTYIVTTEVTYLVDTNNITDEDAYMIFKELKEQGIIWTDPKPINIGRIHLNKDEKQLNEEYLVIIDPEFIYLENDPDIEYGNLYYYKKFNNRYLQEHQNMHL